MDFRHKELCFLDVVQIVLVFQAFFFQKFVIFFAQLVLYPSFLLLKYLMNESLNLSLIFIDELTFTIKIVLDTKCVEYYMCDPDLLILEGVLWLSLLFYLLFMNSYKIGLNKIDWLLRFNSMNNQFSFLNLNCWIN